MMNIESLLGKKVGLCGASNCVVFLKLDDGKIHAFEAVQNEEDGYRSMMSEVAEVSMKGQSGYFRTPVAEVTVSRSDRGGEFDGYTLSDGLGHPWVRFGTSNADEYYPQFVFDYSPVAVGLRQHHGQQCKSTVNWGRVRPCRSRPPRRPSGQSPPAP